MGDLDFTVLDQTSLEEIARNLAEEVPRIVNEASGIPVRLRDKPYINPGYVQSRFQYQGPISPNTVKIEASREAYVGKATRMGVPRDFDYPAFRVKVYTLDEILAEKLRTLLERGKVKDYYDVWKLLRTRSFDAAIVTGFS